MNRLCKTLLLAGLLGLLAGCPQPKPGTDRADLGEQTDAGADLGSGADLGTADSGADAGEPDEGFAPAPQTIFSPSSGGGIRDSTSFTMRLLVSPPTPSVERNSRTYNLRLGAGAAQESNLE